MNYLQRKKQFFQFADLPQIIKKGKLRADYDELKLNYYLRIEYSDLIYAYSMRIYAIKIPKNAKKLIINNGNKNISSSRYLHGIGVGSSFESKIIVLGTSATNYIEIEIKESYFEKLFFITVDDYKCDTSNCIFEITS